jgi:formate-dependent nitrite reductase membrane component NrfD
MITSPMSWGSWILLLIYPVTVLFIAGLIMEELKDPGDVAPLLKRAGGLYAEKGPGFEKLKALYEKRKGWLEKPGAWITQNIRFLAWASIGLGIALGAYTGILLSSYAARPLWNSQALAPLFLVSGLSSAAALSIIAERKTEARHEMARIDRVFIAVELFILFLLFVNLAYSIQSHQWALEPFIGNEVYTPLFWILVVGLGLITPLILELLEVRKVIKYTIAVPILVLVGGLFLRFVFVYAGQAVCWCYFVFR